MKTSIGVIVLLLVIVGAWTLLKNPSSQTSKDKAPLVTENEVGSKALTDGNYKVDTESSQVMWQGSKPLVTNYFDQGTIKISGGELKVAGGAISGGTFTIDMNSITASKTGKGSGEDGLSKHLKSADFFDVAVHPTSTFTVTNVNGNNITGDLTIKGVTKSITFPATISESGSKVTAIAKIEINRAEFNVRYGSGTFFENLGNNLISDTFDVDLNLVVER